MEILEALTIFGVLGVVFTSIILVLFRIFPQKSAKKQIDYSLINAQKAYQATVEESLAMKDKMIKSINSQNNLLRKELHPVDEEGEPIKESVPWEVIAAGAEQMGIPSAMLIPFKKQILKYTKGMSIEEIQQSAGSIKGLLGSQQPKGEAQDQSGSAFA